MREAATFLVCAIVAVLLLAPQTNPASSSSLPTGVDRLVNNRSADSYPQITQSETSIAASGDNVVVGWNDKAVSCSEVGYGRSSDGGATWSDLGFLPTGGSAAGIHADPVLGTNHLGQFFFAALAQQASPVAEPCGGNFFPVDATDGRSFIGLWRSTDSGATFQFLADASAGTSSSNFQDKEEMAIDTNASSAFQGRIYVCWTEIVPSSGDTRIYVSALDNTGTLLVNPTIVGTASIFVPSPKFVQGCALAVEPDGTNGRVYVAWGESPVTVTTFPTFKVTLPAGTTGSVKVRRSDNGGATWQPVVDAGSGVVAGDPSVDCTVNMGSFEFRPPALKGSIRDAPIPTLAVSPGGQVNLAATAGVGPGGGPWLGDIKYTRSMDMGATWSAPITINSVSTNDQFQPRMATDSLGTIAIMWYDRRHDSNNLRVHLREAVSLDNGSTWHEAQVTDADFGVPPLNPNFDPGFGKCYMGDYNALVAHQSRFLMAWGDNRLDTSSYAGGPATPHPDPDIRFDDHSGTDLDGDTFSNQLEAHVGTDPFLGCGANALPADFNDDGFITGFDLSSVASDIGQTVPPGPVRKDIASEPVGDNAISGADLSAVAGRIGQSCS